MRARTLLRAAAPALAVTGLTVACADAPTGPAPSAAAFAKAAPTAGGTTITSSYDKSTSPIRPADWLDETAGSSFKSTDPGVQQQYVVGDTTVTLIQVGTDPKKPALFDIGNTNRLEFPYNAASICADGSSYGPGTWDSACARSTDPVRIVAKSWVNAEGKVATDFEPALRFVPGLPKLPALVLKDAALAGTRVDYCSKAGCVDETAADPTVAPVLDPSNGKVTRRIKHFSGYTVVANRTYLAY